MNGQKGMTMVELVVAIATTGIITAFLGTAVYQILTVSGYGNDQLTAAHELQNAAYWFNIDGQGAKAATGSTRLTLTMTDNSTITYRLVGTQLRRTRTTLTAEPTVIPVRTIEAISAEPGEVRVGQAMVLARNITSASFSVADRVITMSLTATPSEQYGVSENGTYRVHLRPAEGS